MLVFPHIRVRVVFVEAHRKLSTNTEGSKGSLVPLILLTMQACLFHIRYKPPVKSKIAPFEMEISARLFQEHFDMLYPFPQHTAT